VKPPPFEYRAPRTVEETLEALADAPDETTLLAGGQSLVPLLNMRLASPRVVVDLNRVEGLDAVESTDERLQLGAMVRQRTLEVEENLRGRLPLLAEAVGHIAHVPIRTRGTLGGSLAHGDPSAELPVVIAALDGRMILQSADRGSRSVTASEFFLAPLMTAIEPGEMLVGVEVTPPPSGTGWAFLEVARVHGAFALAGVAVLLHVGSDGRIDLARVALSGVDAVPYVPAWLDEAVIGEPSSESIYSHVGDRIRGELQRSVDERSERRYGRTVAGVLTVRALMTAARRAGAAVEEG
jgi:CO/xanthine dehydrogenase FAD-binding subunit